MIKFENTEVFGWETAIRGMRNPKNSWENSDSGWSTEWPHDEEGRIFVKENGWDDLSIGPKDAGLMMSLRKAGTDHRKFMRFINVTADLVAPLYWWKEYDTYKVGTVANSCFTMHKIHEKEIELSDFSIDDFYIDGECIDLGDCFRNVVSDCENLRKKFLETNDKKYWKGLIQLLPSGYNQRRTVQLNYEVLANMYKSRKDHKLTEWREFCEWTENLPYSELITGKNENK